MILNLEYITNYIDKKIEENENIIMVKYYDLKVKAGMTEEQIQQFLNLSKTRLNNLNYKIYESGNFYILDGKKYEVENNVYYVAIKE